MDEEYGNDLVDAYICVMESLATRSEDKVSHRATSKFHAEKIPSISVDAYVKRIVRHFQCSYECFVCSLAYIELMLQNSDFVLNSYSIHRVVLITVMAAAKFYDDNFFTNELYAKVGGISVEELNELELEFVFLVGFSLVIPSDEYQKLHNNLYIHCREICSHCRGLHFPSLHFKKSVAQSRLEYRD